MEFKILSELRDLLPPLTAEEKRLLEEGILKQGIERNLSIAFIDGVATLIDGHNRYSIAKKHNLPFKTTLIDDVKSIDDAIVWMIDNQEGQRNLTDGWKWELAQKKKEVLLRRGKKKISEIRQIDNKTNPRKSDSSLSIIDKDENLKINKPTHNTQKELASSLGWSTGKVAMADKVWKEAPEEIKEKVKEGAMSVSAAYQKTKEVTKRQKVEQIAGKEEWPSDQLELKKKVEAGESVAINMNKHFHLLKWAQDNNKYVRVDRYTEWGNPFELPKDGNRDEVCDAYESHYFPYKKSLHLKIADLEGKVLGCHCHPQRCHAHFLSNLANSNNNE